MGEHLNRLRQGLRLKGAKILVRSSRGSLQSLATPLNRDENSSVVQPELVMDEFIGMLSFDIKFIEIFRREVFEIERDDRVRLAVYGGCKNVAVIGIWQLQ
jgi:hypothetical protein